MKSNPILEEIWKIKDDLDHESGHDLHRYCDNLRNWITQHPPSGPIVRNGAELRQLIAQQERKQVEESGLVLKEKD